MLPDEIRTALEIYWEENSLSTTVDHIQSIGGGSINHAYKVTTSSGSYFLKYNEAQAHPNMFSSEYKGLKVLADTKTIRIPEALYYYEGEEYSCILMEYILETNPSNYFWKSFAQNLANLHRYSADSFGLDFSNYMGSLPQSNRQHTTFIDFFIEERLQPQIILARDNGYLHSAHIRKAEKLYQELSSIIPEEKQALVHGDLWSGNFMCDEKGEPLIMDPAIYYGHREVDIAMTTMFGGFSQEFFQYYQQNFPMEQAWEQRLPIYNLYPILIHINLFGKSYLSGFERVLKRF